MELKYSIVRKRVKNLRITIKNTGDIIVSSPWFYTKGQIDKVVMAKKDWIEKKLKKFENNGDILDTEPGKIIYFGDKYDFILDEKLKSDNIDTENKSITSKMDLSKESNLNSWYKKKAKEYLTRRTEELIAEHSFKVGKITVRSQKTRWGSCSAKNDISLNSALLKCPSGVIDYVIYHELAHTVQKNHSKSFWDLVGRYVSDYKELRNWLKKHGGKLIVP